MKLSQYAKEQGISYRTAFRWWQAGQIKGYQAPSGTIIITPEEPLSQVEKVAIYARVSTRERKDHLERQVERLRSYCAAKGYQISLSVKEIAPGVNDSCPKLLALLKDTSVTRIVVEHRDRLTRFGFPYLETLLEMQGRTIEVMNQAEDEKEDLMADLTAILYSLTARMYGQRRAKRKTAKILQQLEAKDEEE
ncbi:IS607 family transposase [Ktedonobacter robiniae]|uniref:IS607 family transposase n=1 Tax=Ktedonobacter robiniae TaxID=2778365 RepID=A0ABQ3UGE3_9CHLR|nr:IS607 family transposase [Ktedonobacter robiniae]GHO51767.1 IS607 family transposase [Ktedonobacter robiniae]